MTGLPEIRTEQIAKHGTGVVGASFRQRCRSRSTTMGARVAARAVAGSTRLAAVLLGYAFWSLSAPDSLADTAPCTNYREIAPTQLSIPEMREMLQSVDANSVTFSISAPVARENDGLWDDPYFRLLAGYRDAVLGFDAAALGHFEMAMYIAAENNLCELREFIFFTIAGRKAVIRTVIPATEPGNRLYQSFTSNITGLSIGIPLFAGQLDNLSCILEPVLKVRDRG